MGFTFNWCARLRERVNLNACFRVLRLGVRSCFGSTCGICVLDLYLYIKTNFNMANYSLKSVCKFIRARTKWICPTTRCSASTRAVILWSYRLLPCTVYGRDLCIILCESKAAFVSNIVEMSRVCYTSMPDIVTRGQQIKYSQVARNAEEMGFAMNSSIYRHPRPTKERQCLYPLRGTTNIPLHLDFASLYPLSCRRTIYATQRIDLKDRNKMLDLQRRGRSNRRRRRRLRVHFSHPDSFKGLLPVVLNNTLERAAQLKSS